MKKTRFGLLSRIVLAVVLGIVLGSFAPAPFVRGVNTVAALIGQFIKFLVPLIIVGLVAPAIAETGRGAEVNLATFAGFIAMVGIVMIAAPGVPGGGVMSAIGLLESMLGFDHAQIALMIALYLATDSIGTACNIAGDGAIAIIVDKMFGASRKPSCEIKIEGKVER